MKTNILFERLAHISLIVVIACSFLAIPNRAVSAKVLAAPFTDCATQTQIPAAECDALLALYTDMGGASWYNHTDWLQTDTPCSWYSIACNSGTNVTGISLVQNNLSGSIPAELANLTELTALELFKNSLSGSIPVELASLSHLATLNLRSNGLTGSIPTELANLTNLTTLELQSNHLSGPIPTELASLTNLTTLALYGNDLSGPIPTEFGSLTNLATLNLADNALSGSIPPELGSLTNLTTLNLSPNALSGPIPPELGNLINLTVLNLSANALSGSIPASVSNLINLTALNLSGNALSGSIPIGVGNLTQLHGLYLDHNALSGSIPPELDNLINLTRLDLSSNELSGSIPSGVGGLTNLSDLDLHANQLTGSMPTELGNLTNLFSLYLDNNQLSGEFPASITNLSNLSSLTFDCELTSSDPDVIAFIDVRAPDWQNNTCPSLVAPSEGASLDNGRLDRLDDIVWDFDWSDVPDATKYQLYVNHSGAPTPIINNANITNSSYHYGSLNSYITQSNRYNWTWQVRAYINGQWGEWSEIRSFSVEPPNTDAPQALAKNGGFNVYPSRSRIPANWKAVNFSAKDGKTTSIKQEGTASVKITGAVGKIKTLSQTLKVSGPAGDPFIFSYWVKGSAVPATDICQGRVSFYSGTTLKGTKTLRCPTAINNFRKMTLKLSAPTAYNKVVITFTYSKPSGTVWFDTVSLIR